MAGILNGGVRNSTITPAHPPQASVPTRSLFSETISSVRHKAESLANVLNYKSKLLQIQYSVTARTPVETSLIGLKRRTHLMNRFQAIGFMQHEFKNYMKLVL